MQQRRLIVYLLYTLMALFLATFLFFPLVEVLRGGLTDERGRFTILYLVEAFRNPLFREGLVNSVWIALGATALAMLLAAPLVPYKTVGVFLASIMVISGLGTMLMLPAAITMLKKKLFKNQP
jgi:ABC-type spermidine/putrescine transport system permease subunit II